MRVGTPPILALAALDAALDVWNGVDMNDVRAAALRLADQFIAGVEARCPGLELASPRDGSRRGSQVSFRHTHGYAIMPALIARGVIGDLRAPDILRFGLTPLYIGENDILAAVDVMTRSRCMGRSRGGLTTKIHALVDALGLPILLKLTEGQAHDGRSADDMLGGLGDGDVLLTDRAYDSGAMRAKLAENETTTSSPPSISPQQ